MSFLLSEGHIHARHYPLCMLWREADLARDRIREVNVTNTLLMQSAIGSVISEKGAENFQKLVKDLSDNGEAD